MFKRFRNAWKIARMMDEQKSITPMDTLPSYKSNKAIWKEWDTNNAIRHGYKASTWVYSCINRIAKTASSVPWKVYRETDEGLEEIPNHPLEQLLKKPNPYMSGQDFFERLISHLYLGGNSVTSKVRANNIVAELWPLMPDEVSPVPSKSDFITYYEWKRDGRTQRIDSEDILHIMFIDPSNIYWGMGPLQAVARSVDTDVELLEWQKVSIQNRAITDGVFSFKQPLTRDQWEQAREMVRDQHMGPSNARTPWVLGGEAEWQQMSLSPQEMDFIESREFTREEICSVFQVPPPLVGLYDNATLANIETSRKIFWLDTIVPLLDDLKSSFNLTLTPEFGNDIVLGYDISNVQAIQENYHEKVDTAEKLWSMGIPFNDINQRLELGFDEVVGGERGYLPLNLAISEEVADGSNNVDVDVNRNENQNSYTPQNKKDATIHATQSKAWNLETDEQKEMYWKNLEDRRIGWIGQFAKRAKRLFEDESEAVVEEFENNGALSALNAIDERKSQWEQVTTTIIMDIIEDFGRDTWNQIKSQRAPKTKDEFDPWDENIQTWVAERTANLVTYVSDTTKDLVRNVIAEGQEEGYGNDVIAVMIRNRYEDFSSRRSEVIARTETVASSNYGSLASAKQTGLNAKKVWVSSRDERVRDSHEVIDGTTIGMDDYFYVGGTRMQFPADMGGPAKEVVNCRCTLAYRVV